MAIDKIPTLYYDSEQQQISVADLANFIWTTVVAQSAGSHGHLVNTYDITRFTFRYYQLAVHMPNDNLIFLIRKLLALPNASNYFPYLALKSGRVHLVGPGGKQVSLETVTTVTRPNGKVEDQIVGFMSYLNPDTHNVGEIEVLNTARLMHWLLSDAEAVKASVATALEIMKRKLKRAAKTYGLAGKSPELAIWVSDIIHQGRGSGATIKQTLAKPDFDSQMQALSLIGSETADYEGRRKTVRDCISKFVSEKRFDGKLLGQGKLSLG